MGVFTLHNKTGCLMSNKFRNLDSAIKECNKMGFYCSVMEEYLAPSPWNKSKTTKHAKEVYNNQY